MLYINIYSRIWAPNLAFLGHAQAPSFFFVKTKPRHHRENHFHESHSSPPSFILIVKVVGSKNSIFVVGLGVALVFWSPQSTHETLLPAVPLVSPNFRQTFGKHFPNRTGLRATLVQKRFFSQREQHFASASPIWPPFGRKRPNKHLPNSLEKRHKAIMETFHSNHGKNDEKLLAPQP